MDTGTTYLLDAISPIHINIEKELSSANFDNSSVLEVQTTFQECMKNVVFDQNIFYDILFIYQENIFSTSSKSSYPTNLNTDFINKITSSDELLIEGPVVKMDEQQVILIGTPLKADTSKKIGLVYAIQTNQLKTILNINSKNNSENMILSNQTIIASNKEEMIGKILYDSDIFNIKNADYKITTINGKKSIIAIQLGKNSKEQYNFNWKYISILDYESLAKDINTLNRNILLIALISAVISFIMAYLLSFGLIKPIRTLQLKMKNYHEGDGGIITSSSDEIIELENSFNDMIERITSLIEENAIQQENKRKLELYALQMQINPHFLYNTLDAIAWLAKLKKQPEIEQLVMALAQFFRISLHKGDKFIKVEEEIELIKNYIAIEQIRFPNKFTIDYEIEDNVKEYESMKLILQPLVENAIKHGISQLEGSGKITIKAYMDDQYIYYEVIDNGLGFDIEQIKSRSKLMSGYGCKNVDERIKLEYGLGSGLEIHTKKGEGTRVIVKFLKRTL